MCRGRTVCRAQFFCRVSHNAFNGNRGTSVESFAPKRGQVYPDGRRDCVHGRHYRCVPYRQQSYDRHQRSRLFFDAGGVGVCHHGGNSLCHCQCSAGGAFHGDSHPCEPGGRQSGPLGNPRRPCHCCPYGIQPPGCV